MSISSHENLLISLTPNIPTNKFSTSLDTFAGNLSGWVLIFFNNSVGDLAVQGAFYILNIKN